MRPGQVGWYVLRRGLGVGRGAIRRGAVGPRGIASHTAFIRPETGQDLVEGVAFLNRFRGFGSGPIDWRAAEMPKLWRYNLHYFDYLHWAGVSDRRKAELIASWIGANPWGTPDAWEPYTVSLRIVNWVKLFLRPEWREDVSQVWLESLANQAAWLARNLEHHILANHYLKNGKALLFAGLFFDGSEAEAWRRQGLAILCAEAAEQFNADGAHYELSPMYHALCTEDYLDALNLLLGAGVPAEDEAARLFAETARAALDFLARVTFPDGDIPLFNDAAFGIAPRTDALVAYGERLFGYRAPAREEREILCFPASGYFGARRGRDMWLADCGPVSPAYQPGHTHCDMLSFELALDGRRVAVDNGVHDYEAGESRHYARSTAAHNTVTVDGAEQSELWGAFRVARRARPLHSALRETAQGVRFEAAVRGFPALGAGIVHRRVIDYAWEGTWRVTDTIEGRGRHRVESRLHFHPDLRVEIDGGVVAVADASERVLLTATPGEGADPVLERGWYFPEFGVKRENAVMVLRCDAVLPVGLGYTLRRVGS
jgi:uncharacterized heparinase superfamily protein